jgi:phospholipase/carboxylesterase
VTVLTRPHVWRSATTTAPPLLLLHGTGGDEHDLVPLADRVAPGAAVLAPRGTVLEGAVNRFCRRPAEGVSDEDDLRLRAGELADFVRAAGAGYGLAAGSPLAMAFSHGAHMAAALLLLHPDVLAGAVLLAGVPPLAETPDVDLTGKRVLVSNGLHDPVARPEQTDRLVRDLADRGADVRLLTHGGGHEVDPAHLPAIREFLREA